MDISSGFYFVAVNDFDRNNGYIGYKCYNGYIGYKRNNDDISATSATSATLAIYSDLSCSTFPEVLQKDN